MCFMYVGNSLAPCRYGFPESVAEAMTPRNWAMDVGAVTSIVSPGFSGHQPPIMHWHTLNVGPEMMAGPGAVAVWELADFDVLVQAPAAAP